MARATSHPTRYGFAWSLGPHKCLAQHTTPNQLAPSFKPTQIYKLLQATTNYYKLLQTTMFWNKSKPAVVPRPTDPSSLEKGKEPDRRSSFVCCQSQSSAASPNLTPIVELFRLFLPTVPSKIPPYIATPTPTIRLRFQSPFPFANPIYARAR